jgi:hypothetical protein
LSVFFLPVLFCLSYLVCLSCSGCPVTEFLFCLTRSGCPILAVLF